MKYIKQFSIILIISFIGEILNDLIPLPIPASIYGIILLFIGLETRIIPLHAVKETGDFLIEIMPLMFVPPAVGLLEAWDIIKPSFGPYITMTLVSTFAVMLAAGRITQAFIRYKNRKAEQK